MPTLKIEINLDNDAFSGNSAQETARILQDYADQLENLCQVPREKMILRDINGNTVGFAKKSFT